MMNNMKAVIVLALICGMTAIGEQSTNLVQDVGGKDFSVRVSFGSAPGIDEVEAGGISSSIPDDGGATVQILAAKRNWSKNNPSIGGVFGGGIFSSVHDSSDGIETVEITAVGLMVEGGLAIKAGDYVVFEAVPYLGIGVAENELYVPAVGLDDSGRGAYYMYGIKAGVFVSLAKNVEVGLEAGAYGFSQDQEISIMGTTEEFTFSGDGASVSLVFAAKF